MLVHRIDHEYYTIITKRGQPLGVTVSFDSHILDGGLRESISPKAFIVYMIKMGKLKVQNRAVICQFIEQNYQSVDNSFH